jgi:hypothetical protein
MRRLASAFLAVSMAGGCVSSDPHTDGAGHVTGWDRRTVRTAPGYIGPQGEKVPVTLAGVRPPAKSQFGSSARQDKGGVVQADATMPQSGNPNIQQAVNFGPLNPQGLQHAPWNPPTGAAVNGSPVAGPPRYPAERTQVRFVRPSGMKISWFTQGPDGRPAYSPAPIEAPGRYNFAQAAIYRLKLSNIEGRPGLEVYPTIEVFPTNPKTESFLAHSAVPVDFTPDDFKQIADGSYVVKVIYLPDPAFQDAASTGTEEILSTRLEPGVDPIQEAIRRGSILLIVRMGNVDEEAPNTPPLNAAAPGGAGMANPILNFGPTTGGQPGTMVPFGPTGSPLPPMGPGMKSAPGALPPAISAAPTAMPKVPAMTTSLPSSSRPGMATASSSKTPPSLPPAAMPQVPPMPAPPPMAAPAPINLPPVAAPSIASPLAPPMAQPAPISPPGTIVIPPTTPNGPDLR